MQPSTDRSEWLTERRSFLGASEVAAVVGANPFHTALDVWAEKRGISERKENEPTRAGHIFESVLLGEYADRFRCDMEYPGSLRGAEEWIEASPDACAVYRSRNPEELTIERRNVQAKVVGYRVAHHWGDESEGAEGVPAYVYLQLQWEMLVARLAFSDVIAALGSEIRIYRDIARDDETIGLLVEQCRDFWHRCVVGGELPVVDGSESARRVIERLFPRARRSTTAAPSQDFIALAQRYDDARAAEARAVAEKEEAGNLLRVAVGDRSGFAGRWGSVTWGENEKGRTDWQAIAVEAGATSELIAKHTAPSGRVLRVNLKGNGNGSPDVSNRRS